ncbi:hypothetical protein AAHA92_27309 [Salvia divinorum]|uniref:Uncharacterized protein n=1 Tax=Salvia divinorum TaxID=28513 RepID=A0ABD1G386_SALDI
MFVGILCNIFQIITYASPLFNLRNVVKTQSVKFMPFWLIFVGFANGIAWLTYGLLKTFDPYIAVGNGIGALFALIQLVVFAYYKFKRNDFSDSSISSIETSTSEETTTSESTSSLSDA